MGIMATPREAAELASRIADPGFTPSVRTLRSLLDLVAGDDEGIARTAERAVLRIEAQYAARVAAETAARARAAERPARGRLTRLVARLVTEARDPDGIALAWLLDALGDADPKARRAAARGLGNATRSEKIESALARAFDQAEADDDRRVLAEALGKTGGEAARARLAGGEHGRSSLIAERERARRTPGKIDPSRVHAEPLRLRFHTRSGLEDVLMDELGSSFGQARLLAPGVVEARLGGPLAQALAVRTAVEVGFPLDPAPRSADLAEDVVSALASPAALAIFHAYTATEEGAPIRFRIAFRRGGHRRAVVWRAAERIRAKTSALVNDPTASTWEVSVDEVGGEVRVELVPRGYDDERFAYRRALVPASSHPVIAAALARIAPRRDDDVVWDPFVGAGAELVERARLGSYARLVGSDVDERAASAARTNLHRAGVERASVVQASACEHAPAGVTLILTNPPMGRRVQRGEHVELLERFLAHAARVLVPGGALVWIVPEPRRLRARAAAVGLELERATAVDMGGFSAEMSVYLDTRAPTRARP